MRSHRLLTAAVSCITLLTAMPAVAQGTVTNTDSFFDIFLATSEGQALPAGQATDSFFDVFTRIDIPETVPPAPECLLCDALLLEISAWEDALDKEADDIDALFDLLEGLERAAQSLEEDLQEAQQALEDFENPRSSADADGRKLDSSDLQVLRAYNRELWQQYEAGEISAEKLEQSWKEGLSDEELADRKREMQNVLKERVREAQRSLEELQGQMAQIGQDIKDKADAFEESLKELQELRDRYEECLKQCRERDLTLGDLGVRTEERNIFERLFESMRGLFGGGDEGGLALEILPQGEEGQDGGTIDTEMVQLDLSGGPRSIAQGQPVPPLLPDSFFDIFYEIDIPSPPQVRCIFCDPIFYAIERKDRELGSIDEMLRDVEKDIRRLDGELRNARDDLARAGEALDRFENPRSWAESGGKRLDSSDLEAMRAWNKSLWGRYRSGDISAQDLEDAWKQGPGAEELADIKEHIRTELQDAVRRAQEQVDHVTEARMGAEKQAQDLKQKAEAILAEIEALENDYEECLKKCTEKTDEDLFHIGEFFSPEVLERFSPAAPVVEKVETGFFAAIVEWVAEIFTTETPKDTCPVPGLSLPGCIDACGGEQYCMMTGRTEEGTDCYECYFPKERDEQCEPPSLSWEECAKTCGGEEHCSLAGKLSDATECWTCKEECPAGSTLSQEVCRKTCDGTCAPKGVSNAGTPCYACIETTTPKERCPASSMPRADCAKACNGERYCAPFATLGDGTECWSCQEECPAGSALSQELCTKNCDGTCAPKGVSNIGDPCYACTQTSMPKEQCPSATALETVCLATCDGICRPASTLSDGSRCFRCEEVDSCMQKGMLSLEECELTCGGPCEEVSKSERGKPCYGCKPVTVTPPKQEKCELPSMTGSECDSICADSCKFVKRLSNGVSCYECREEPSDAEQCPSGTTDDFSDCEDRCGNGLCMGAGSAGGKTCYSCVKCPSGTFSTQGACNDGCTGGACTVAATQGELRCWQCVQEQSCEDVCAGQGYEYGVDYNSYILSELNKHTCVSGAHFSMQTATIGQCQCTKKPLIEVDTTVPICKGSPCGDVACGSSVSCQTGPTQTTTVHCNWGGWKKIGDMQYQPVIGG